MNSFDRIIDLVHRTQLPIMIQSPQREGEPCVVVPLALYERLVAGGLSQSPHQNQPISFEEGKLGIHGKKESLLETLFGDAPSQDVPPMLKEEDSVLRLQDLLSSNQPAGVPVSLSADGSQAGSLEDRFVFDGLDVRILPHSRQKNASEQESLDES